MHDNANALSCTELDAYDGEDGSFYMNILPPKTKGEKKKKTATTAKGRKNPSSWEARPHPRHTYIIKNGYGFVESAYKTQYQWLHLVGLFRCSFQMGDYKFVYF